MLTPLAESVADLNSPGGVRHLPVALIVSMPLSLIVDADPFYFAVLPLPVEIPEFRSPYHTGCQGAILRRTTSNFPVSPVTPSTSLLVSFTGIDLGEHPKLRTPFPWIATLVMTVAAVLLGILRTVFR